MDAEGGKPGEDHPLGDMEWLNEPPSARLEGDDLVVETGSNTDFWRVTAYGPTHDDGHFLGAPLQGDTAIEVTFQAEFMAQFDQAGLMLRADAKSWLKTGVELCDGELYASVVVTDPMSDWSVAPIPGSARGRALTVRASRKGDAVTVRYRPGEDPDRHLLRVAHLRAEVGLRAGPMCCSPTRAGLSVRFEPVRVGPPDAHLHG
jgi:regulation of enolase protein 1 (concanavalin A-like superfamily)